MLWGSPTSPLCHAVTVPVALHLRNLLLNLPIWDACHLEAASVRLGNSNSRAVCVISLFWVFRLFPLSVQVDLRYPYFLRACDPKNPLNGRKRKDEDPPKKTDPRISGTEGSKSTEPPMRLCKVLSLTKLNGLWGCGVAVSVTQKWRIREIKVLRGRISRGNRGQTGPFGAAFSFLGGRESCTIGPCPSYISFLSSIPSSFPPRRTGDYIYNLLGCFQGG